MCVCSRHRDRVVRRGIGMTIESDFYATEAGRAHFSDQLTSIRYVSGAFHSNAILLSTHRLITDVLLVLLFCSVSRRLATLMRFSLTLPAAT